MSCRYIANDTIREETFFYHNDYLGSTPYITDDKANIKMPARTIMMQDI